MSDEYRNGLNDNEVIASRNAHGSNRLSQKKRQGFWRQYLSNFGDPIIKVLLISLALNLLFLFRNQDWFESIGIAVAVFLATFVSTISEYGSESAFEKLQEEAAGVTCRVYRNRKLCAIPIEELVVGDMVELQSGECVPADGVMISGTIRVDLSALNGESVEMRKNVNDEVLRGSVVCFGSGVITIRRVGDKTVYGQVADEIQDETRESPLKHRLAALATTLSRIGFVAAGMVALADLFHRFVIENHYITSQILADLSSPSIVISSLLHAVTLAITVVVVAVPEGLPMMITVVLSSNMRRMLKDHVLVRKLVGIETSGSINILFTDKTGTLTEGKPRVSLFVTGEGQSYHDIHDLRRHKKLSEAVMLSGLYNTESRLSDGDVLGGNATDRALLEYICGRHPLHFNRVVVNRIPFDSDRKWSAVELDHSSEGPFTLYKGAPDRLIGLCTRYLSSDGNIYPLFSAPSPEPMENKAMRVVLLAISDKPLATSPKDLILIGLAGLRDEIRADVRQAVKQVRQAGIQTVMITGDSRKTAQAIALSAGLISRRSASSSVITGKELAMMSDQEVKDALPNLRVVARALPADKSRLVRLSQECGLVVGMTGDGVNDAPALKKADVGFAMGSGTEVAKQAGDIVILNDHFASVTKAILYGRTIFKSIRKFIIFQLTMNLCAVAVSIVGPFIGIETPVTVMQMLWINIIMDTLAGLAFAGEPPLEEYMREPPKRRDEPILNRYMLHQILCTGGFTVALSVAFLRMDLSKILFRYHIQPIYWMTAFFALFIFCGIFNSFNARTTRLNLLSNIRRNPLFIVIMVTVSIIQVILIYYGGSLFRTAALTVKELSLIALLAAMVIPFDLLRKSAIRVCHRHGTL